MYSSQFNVANVNYQPEYFEHEEHIDRQQSDPQEGLEHETNEWSRGESNDNFKVVVRVRPPLPRELRGYKPYQCTAAVDYASQSITISENLQAVANGTAGLANDGLLYATYRFTFDHVYDTTSTQEDVYQHSARQMVLSTLQGYNATIIAYGQTGTGKTYTMEGEPSGPLRGIIPRTVGDIFRQIDTDPDPTAKYLVRASYLQIYNEVISDLLKPERTNLVIREDRRRGVFVDGLSEWVVRSPNEVYGLMQRGSEQRATGATKMNEVSSRSHAVCCIVVEKCTSDVSSSGALDTSASAGSRPGSAPGSIVTGGRDPNQIIKVGKLNLVDLAGSERVHITGATGKRLEESKKINASLSALGNVIAALTDRRDRQHIPYRDSKLTRILEDSLGGNCKTTMMCMISPSMDAFQESLSTLKFANRAKNIKNQAVVNEDLDQRTLLRKYERELKKLRSELTRRNRELVDKRALLEIEEQKRRAEADKLAALTALEKRSQEFMREKEEKKALEAKINAMQGQMLGQHAGSNGMLADMPAFRAALQKENSRIRGEYELRLKELEAERASVEEDLAQVDRYKTLLLKQRDIMIALTARLNERDEQIVTLQEELEAYDKHQRKLEDALDQKTAELIALRKAALEHAAVSPMKNTPLASALGDWGGMATPRGPPPGRQGSATPFAEAAGQQQQQQQQQQQGGGFEVSALLDSTRPGSAGSVADQLSNLHLQAQALQQELGGREQQIRELEEQNRRLGLKLQQTQLALQAAAAGGGGGGDAARLQQEVSGHIKERLALRTIIESKVLPLADDLSRSLEQGGQAGAGSRTGKQLAALRHLLAATVKAMSRAEGQ